MGKEKGKIRVVCAQCGKVEYVWPSRAKHYKCCSQQCLGKYNSIHYSMRVTLTCPICGKTYECKQSKINHHRTCGDEECRTAWRKQINSGKGNPRYKSVESILMSQSTHMPKVHDQSRTIYQHVVKEILGLTSVQRLPKGYVIHHKDANHSNNDPHNLVVLPKTPHRLIHTIFGNVLIGALHTGRITRKTFRKICNDEQWNFYKEIIDLDVTKQVIVKESEKKEKQENESVYKQIIIYNKQNED